MNNTQLVVRLNDADENFKQLELLGFCNIQRLTKDNYNFPVIVVDLRKRQFFGTNTICMAASTSGGNKSIVLDFKQLKEKLSIQ